MVIYALQKLIMNNSNTRTSVQKNVMVGVIDLSTNKKGIDDNGILILRSPPS